MDKTVENLGIGGGGQPDRLYTGASNASARHRQGVASRRMNRYKHVVFAGAVPEPGGA
jgi:hypothetical protein